MTQNIYRPIPKQDLSQRLNTVLDQLEVITRDVTSVGDELMIQYLIENGDLKPDDITDFIGRKDV